MIIGRDVGLLHTVVDNRRQPDLTDYLNLLFSGQLWKLNIILNFTIYFWERIVA